MGYAKDLNNNTFLKFKLIDNQVNTGFWNIKVSNVRTKEDFNHFKYGIKLEDVSTSWITGVQFNHINLHTSEYFIHLVHEGAAMPLGDWIFNDCAIQGYTKTKVFFTGKNLKGVKLISSTAYDMGTWGGYYFEFLDESRISFVDCQEELTVDSPSTVKNSDGNNARYFYEFTSMIENKIPIKSVSPLYSFNNNFADSGFGNTKSMTLNGTDIFGVSVGIKGVINKMGKNVTATPIDAGFGVDKTGKLYTVKATSEGTELNSVYSTNYMPYGGTASRPNITKVSVGFMMFDVTLNKPIWKNYAGNWVDSNGTVV